MENNTLQSGDSNHNPDYIDYFPITADTVMTYSLFGYYF